MTSEPFLDQTFHAHAFLALWALIQGAEDLFKALNVAFGLFQMPFETLSSFLKRQLSPSSEAL